MKEYPLTVEEKRVSEWKKKKTKQKPELKCGIIIRERGVVMVVVVVVVEGTYSYIHRYVYLIETT